MAIRRAATTKGFQDPRYRALIEELIAERKRQSITQAQLGDRLGLHQAFVSRFERGERRLDAVEFIDVARALSLDPLRALANVSG